MGRPLLSRECWDSWENFECVHLALTDVNILRLQFQISWRLSSNFIIDFFQFHMWQSSGKRRPLFRELVSTISIARCLLWCAGRLMDRHARCNWLPRVEKLAQRGDHSQTFLLKIVCKNDRRQRDRREKERCARADQTVLLRPDTHTLCVHVSLKRTDQKWKQKRNERRHKKRHKNVLPQTQNCSPKKMSTSNPDPMCHTSLHTATQICKGSYWLPTDSARRFMCAIGVLLWLGVLASVLGKEQNTFGKTMCKMRFSKMLLSHAKQSNYHN